MLYSSCWINLNLKKNFFFSYLPIIEWFKASWVPIVYHSEFHQLQDFLNLLVNYLTAVCQRYKKKPHQNNQTLGVSLCHEWPSRQPKFQMSYLVLLLFASFFFPSSRGITLCQKSLDLDQILVKYLNMQFQLYISYTILKKLMSGNCKFHIFFYVQEAQLQKSSDLDQIRTWSVLSDKVPVNAISTLCMHSFKR